MSGSVFVSWIGVDSKFSAPDHQSSPPDPRFYVIMSALPVNWLPIVICMLPPAFYVMCPWSTAVLRTGSRRSPERGINLD